MYSIKVYEVHDKLRGRTYQSIKKAWSSYGPELSYSTFAHRVKTGKYKFLEYKQSKLIIDDYEIASHGKAVVDNTTGRRYSSVKDCAVALGVSYQAVQNALKRKRPCRGHDLRGEINEELR